LADYRDTAFNLRMLKSYARVIGKDYYTKLYVSENILRATIHSVLRFQVGPDWWNQTVDPGIRGTANLVRNRYIMAPTTRNPGRHDIYCVYLSNLGKILFDTKGYFYHVFPNIEKVIIAIEKVQLPRNLTGHMNILTANDKRYVTNFYKLCLDLAKKLDRTPPYIFEYP